MACAFVACDVQADDGVFWVSKEEFGSLVRRVAAAMIKNNNDLVSIITSILTHQS